MSENNSQAQGTPLGTMLGLAGLALGIFSATMMAWKGLGYQPVFHEFFARLEQLAGEAVAPLEEFALRPLIAWVRSFGFDVQLYPHWKHAFVLMWLIFGRSAQVFARLDRSFAVRAWLWSAGLSLLSGLFAGTVPLSSYAVLWWPCATYCAFNVLIMLWPSDWGTDWSGAIGFGLATVAFVALAAGGVPDIVPRHVIPFDDSQSPGLALLACFALVFGCLFVFVGLQDLSEGGKNEYALERGGIDSNLTQLGLSILGILGTAAFLSWLGVVTR